MLFLMISQLMSSSLTLALISSRLTVDAVRAIQTSQAMCANCNLRLHKFAFNSKNSRINLELNIGKNAGPRYLKAHRQPACIAAVLRISRIQKIVFESELSLCGLILFHQTEIECLSNDHPDKTGVSSTVFPFTFIFLPAIDSFYQKIEWLLVHLILAVELEDDLNCQGSRKLFV